MRARLTLAAGTAVLALGGSVFAAAPALAACSSTQIPACTGDTTVLLMNGVSASTGLLSLTGATGAAPLPLTSSGGSLSGDLTPAIVVDTRIPSGLATGIGGTGGSWTLQMATTDFALVNATSTTIPATSAKVKITPVTSLTAAGLSVPTNMLTIAGTSDITTDASAFTAFAAANTALTVAHAVTHNANTFPYYATLSVSPGSAPTGLYTGTVTQSVS